MTSEHHRRRECHRRAKHSTQPQAVSTTEEESRTLDIKSKTEM
jgi:hypothetical protein